MTLTTPSARHLLPIVLGLALGQAGPAAAASLTVSPVSVDLGPRVASSLLTLRNQEDREVRFEVSVFAWTEGEDGRMGLAPTDDLVVFPLLSSIPARSQKVVRVGLAHRAPSPMERTYRVFFQEMAPPRTDDGAPALTFQMRIGIPVFVPPARPSGSAVLELQGVDAGRLRFRVSNPGNSRVRLTSVKVTPERRNGSPLASRDLKAWYLLAGGLRTYDLALEPQACAEVASYLVEAAWAGGSVSSRLPAPAAACE